MGVHVSSPLPGAMVVVLLVAAAAGSAALLGSGFLASPEPPLRAGAGAPLYLGNGLGAFPTEGSLGTHGCPKPARMADVLAGAYPEGAEVCLETATVTWAAPGRDGAFGLAAADGSSLDARVSYRWWQHGTPAAGMVVVVEGVLARAEGAWRIDPVRRWVDLEHRGIGVEAWEVAAGLVPEGTYVWVQRATVFAEWRNNDGDNNVGDNHVETGTLCPTAHLTTETTPPYFGIVPAPPLGATVRMYGSVRYDDGHGWWEIHPIRAWDALPSEALLEGCPEDFGDSGVPPPGFIPDEFPPRARGAWGAVAQDS